MKLQEVERKFLVKNAGFKGSAVTKYEIAQGYLSTDPQRSVRIRIKGDTGFITVKGIVSEEGTTRFEWEKEIPLSEAEALMELCLPGAIRKIRYLIPHGKHTWEVDEFLELNKGLLLAEIELDSASEAFDKPEWVGEEVTGQKKYYNSQLSKEPYSQWK